MFSVGVLVCSSSPPRFVSVEELMETAKGVTNLALAHEIVMNSAFQHGFSPFSSDRENTLKGQIVAAKSADNPIRKVIDSRIQMYLLGFLESSAHRCAPALPGGLTPISKELEEIAVKLGRLVTFNKLVYSPFYHKILQDILKQGESLDVKRMYSTALDWCLSL
uniref:T-complex 11, testis-specific-like 1 n=1 Tax=Cyprinus carpio TaxID=7962 RepID=A0A8C1XNT5_CYPCA